MVTKKHFKNLTIMAVLLAIVVTCFKIASASKETKDNENKLSLRLSEQESLTGNSEFFFKRAGDDRTWHVINRYSSLPFNDSSFCNNSNYLFTKDSVTMINEYLVVTEDGKLDFNLIGFNPAGNNLNRVADYWVN